MEGRTNFITVQNKSIIRGVNDPAWITMNNNNSQVKIGPKPLGAVEQSDEDNIDEYLGYLTFSTTGDVLVPRDWLVEQWENYGLPNRLLPREPTSWMAYRRTMQRLIDQADNSHYEFYSEEHREKLKAKLRLENSDERGSNVFILYADVFHPEEISGEEGGDWVDERIGTFDYLDNDGQGGVLTAGEIGKDSPHRDAWKEVSSLARELHQTTMRTHHNFSDLQKIMQKFRSDTNAVEIRRAVYFVGAHHDQLVEGLSAVWDQMNQFKEGGERMRIETTPVVNLESQRELIAEKAENMVRQTVESLVESVFDSWDEDETSDEIARELMNGLGDEGVTAGINEYNQLLQMKMSVKNILKDQMEEMKEDEQEVIETVLSQKNFNEVEN